MKFTEEALRETNASSPGGSNASDSVEWEEKPHKIPSSNDIMTFTQALLCDTNDAFSKMLATESGIGVDELSKEFKG